MIAAVNPFAIGREGYFDEAKNIHFDDFVYRSPLNPDTAILILRHVHHILMTALIRRIVISILSLETEI